MDLSIVIVNWNGLAVLRPCLQSIYATPRDIKFEVIVVDNASQDDSVAMVTAEFPQVVLVRNRQNRGFAAANNQAFSIARGRYVLLLNNDTIVLDRALEESVLYLDANRRVGAIGCRVEFPDRSFQTSCYRFNNLLELFLTRLLPLGSVWGERLNMGRYWGRQFSEPVEVDAVAGCFMVVRRAVIAEVGGLDEAFFMYGEDEEWCSRIKRGGWSIVYFPRATIIHIHRFSSRQSRRVLRVTERLSPVLVLHKRRGPLVAWLANLFLLLGFIIRMPFWILRDVLQILQGHVDGAMLRSRLAVLRAHIAGIVCPIWMPRNTRSTLTTLPRSHPNRDL